MRHCDVTDVLKSPVHGVSLESNSDPITISSNVFPESKVTFVNVQHSNHKPTVHQHSDHKFNLVIKGIKESPSGAAELERDKYNEALSAFTKLDGDIHPLSVRHCFRLGKFK